MSDDVGRARRRADRGALLSGVVLITVGIALLLGTLGVFDDDFWETLWQLWPAFVIALGAHLALSRARSWLGPAVAGTILVATIAAAAAIAGSGNRLTGGSFDVDVEFGERGTGTAMTVSRELAPFDSILIRGSTDTQVRVGGPQTVRVTADENLVDFIRTDVRGRELVVSRSQPMSPRIRSIVEIRVPSLDAFSAAGSGDAEISGIDGTLLETRILGSGQITVAGRADRLDVVIEGSGDVDAHELLAEAVQVDISGSGNADVHALEWIDIDIRGSGDVTYRGDPTEVVTAVSGSGAVHRR